MRRILSAMLLLILSSVSSGGSANDKKVTLTTPTGGDFSIPTFSGRLETKKLRGKNIFLSFGFTKCPHVCPMTIANLKRMYDQLTPSEKKDIQIIFISIDNERDNLQSFKKYMRPFGPAFVAGTDTDTNLRKITSLFGARFARYRTASKALLVDHTDSVFVINKQGLWAKTLRYNASVEQFLTAYRESDLVTAESLAAKKPREVIEIGSNEMCDLSQKPCKISLPDKNEIEVSVDPVPVETLKEFTVKVKSTSKELTPYEIDITGVQLDMGYIRPKLEPEGSSEFFAKVTLPLCELPRMKWKVNILMKDAKAKDFSALFFVESKDDT